MRTFSKVRQAVKKIPGIKRIYDGVIQFTPKRRRFRRNLIDVERLDKRWGTDFGGRLYWNEIGTTKDRANDYSPSPQKDLLKALEYLHPSVNDCIVDMGSGKGYAMFLMAKYPFCKVAGVELSPLLSKIAENNLNKMLPDTKNWHIYNCDVGMWENYDDFNIFYIYNSFPQNVIHEVNSKICESIMRKPRKVTILYLFPEFPEEFLKDKRWKLIKRGTIFQLRRGMYIFRNIKRNCV